MKKQNENTFGIEQVQTGWGYGTHFELATLIPWMV